MCPCACSLSPQPEFWVRGNLLPHLVSDATGMTDSRGSIAICPGSTDKLIFSVNISLAPARLLTPAVSRGRMGWGRGPLHHNRLRWPQGSPGPSDPAKLGHHTSAAHWQNPNHPQDFCKFPEAYVLWCFLLLFPREAFMIHLSMRPSHPTPL